MSPCAKCAYRRERPGDCHIACDRDLEGVEVQRRTWAGRGFFPLGFDENTVLFCAGQATERDPAVTVPHSPLREILGILGSIGRL